MTIIRLFAAVLALLIAAQSAHAQSNYTIRPGDSLTIEVLEDASLNRSVVVLPDGRFSFPFAGVLSAAGRSVGEVQSAIQQAISPNFAAPPNVFVSVQPAPIEPPKPRGPAQPRTLDIYFMGEVANQGKAEVEPGTTLLQALAVSGGFSRFAATKRVQLRRSDPATGQQKVYQINYKALAEGALAAQDIELRDGDIILVPERRLFE